MGIETDDGCVNRAHIVRIEEYSKGTVLHLSDGTTTRTRQDADSLRYLLAPTLPVTPGFVALFAYAVPGASGDEDPIIIEEESILGWYALPTPAPILASGRTSYFLRYDRDCQAAVQLPNGKVISADEEWHDNRDAFAKEFRRRFEKVNGSQP